MKIDTPYGNNLHISISAKSDLDPSCIKKVLSHIYPGAKVVPFKESDATDIVLIDTDPLSKDELDLLLERTSGFLTILVVADFSKVRNFGHLLSGRLSLCTRKDLEGLGLIQNVQHLLERKKLHDQLAKTSHHLKELSIRDEVTHLFNHRHMDEALATEIKKANRYHRPLSLLIIELRNFTAINELAGHNEADRLLSKVATIIRSIIRDVDVPTRFGDDEFAIILPESDEEAATVVAKRIYNILSSLQVKTKDRDLSVTSCCAVASLSQQFQTKDELLRCALAALQEAKRSKTDNILTASEVCDKSARVQENRQLIENLNERIARLTSETERTFFQSVIRLFGEIPQLKKLIIPHSERVAFFAQRLAETCNLSEADIRIVHRAGLLHDTGKLAIDSEILSKPSQLSKFESDLMRQHPLFAVQILGKSQFISHEIPAILYHHERIDGKGYPEGLLGDAIPIHAKILAIAESWDTMITSQPYRLEPLSLDKALLELEQSAGTQFDEELVSKFMSLISG